jgi:hypothetical protein
MYRVIYNLPLKLLIIAIFFLPLNRVYACSDFILDESYKTSNGPGLICDTAQAGKKKYFLFSKNLSWVHPLEYLNGDIKSSCNHVIERPTSLAWRAHSTEHVLNRKTLKVTIDRSNAHYQCEKYSKSELLKKFRSAVDEKMLNNKL